MVGILELQRFKFTDVVLPVSGVTISGKVNIVDGKVYSTEGPIKCKKDGKHFSFTLYRRDEGIMLDNENALKEEEPLKSSSAWPYGVSVDNTIDEFNNFVLNDIK